MVETSKECYLEKDMKKNAEVKDWKGFLKIGEAKQCIHTLNCGEKFI